MVKEDTGTKQSFWAFLKECALYSKSDEKRCEEVEDLSEDEFFKDRSERELVSLHKGCAFYAGCIHAGKKAMRMLIPFMILALIGLAISIAGLCI